MMLALATAAQLIKCKIIGLARGYLGMNNLREGTGRLVVADVECVLRDRSSTQ